MPTSTETPYTAAQRAVTEAHDRAAEMRKRHETEAEQAQADIDEAVATLRHLKAGTDPDVKLLAEQVIAVYNPQNCLIGEGRSAVNDAIRYLLDGGWRLYDYPPGTKNYASWRGQRSDGRGSPKHGTMIFRIGFTKEVEDRWRAMAADPGRSEPENSPLTAEEIEAAITYLTNLPRMAEQ